ncbi:MAG: NADPH-dependent FMN reductase [Rhodospirillales bacterium]
MVPEDQHKPASGPSLGPVLVLSGSLRPASVTDAVGRHIAADLARAGVETTLMTVRELNLPFYDPVTHATDPGPAAAFVAAALAARAHVWVTPGYHRSVSGSFKNVLDFLEVAAKREPSYLTGKAVGMIAVAGGVPAAVSALTAMEFTAHALRAYVVPYTVPVPFAGQLLDEQGLIKNDGIKTRLDLLAKEIVAFLSNWNDRVERPSVRHGPGG